MAQSCKSTSDQSTTKTGGEREDINYMSWFHHMEEVANDKKAYSADQLNKQKEIYKKFVVSNQLIPIAVKSDNTKERKSVREFSVQNGWKTFYKTQKNSPYLFAVDIQPLQRNKGNIIIAVFEALPQKELKQVDGTNIRIDLSKNAMDQQEAHLQKLTRKLNSFAEKYMGTATIKLEKTFRLRHKSPHPSISQLIGLIVFTGVMYAGLILGGGAIEGYAPITATVGGWIFVGFIAAMIFCIGYTLITVNNWLDNL